jgi:hypothetical protein
MRLAAGWLGASLMVLAPVAANTQEAKAGCGAFQQGICLLSEGLRLAAQDASPEPLPDRRPAKELNTIRDVFDAIRACWLPPPLDQAHEGMEISVRLSFTRAGGVLGEPRFTYRTPGVSQQVRAAYERAVAATLARCTPLRFTPELGGALAGRPFAIRFIDNRSRPERRA